ncbi:hypothetical protein K2X05_00960 [bacterium]|nr:hypothetical protein [bacterium]
MFKLFTHSDNQSDAWGFYFLFYLLSFFVLLEKYQVVLLKNNLFYSSEILFPANILWELRILPTIFFTYFFTLLITLISVLFPFLFFFRFANALSWWILISQLNSYGDVSHDLFGWLTAHLILSISTDKTDVTFFVNLIRSFCLSIYFNSGLWKLRFFLNLEMTDWLWNAATILPSQIARTYSEGLNANLDLMHFLLNHYYLSATLWFFIILAQLSAFPLLFLNRADFYIGLLLVSFHFGTLLSLGVYFQSHIYLLLLIFWIYPKFKFSKQTHD